MGGGGSGFRLLKIAALPQTPPNTAHPQPRKHLASPTQLKSVYLLGRSSASLILMVISLAWDRNAGAISVSNNNMHYGPLRDTESQNIPAPNNPLTCCGDTISSSPPHRAAALAATHKVQLGLRGCVCVCVHALLLVRRHYRCFIRGSHIVFTAGDAAEPHSDEVPWDAL